MSVSERSHSILCHNSLGRVTNYDVMYEMSFRVTRISRLLMIYYIECIYLQHDWSPVDYDLYFIWPNATHI